MSDFGKCLICREYAWLDKHKCAPIYFFKHPHWGDKFQKIRGYSFEDCARKFAELYNGNGDHLLMDADPEEVIISDGKTEKRFIVSAEQSIDYSAEEKKE